VTAVTTGGTATIDNSGNLITLGVSKNDWSTYRTPFYATLAKPSLTSQGRYRCEV